MNDDPLIRSDETDGNDLPGAAAPVIRRESADPDLPKTAREVATSIGALITEVKQLNANARRNRRHIIILAVVLVAVVLLGFQVFRTAECQGRINDATRVALMNRGEAFDKQTAALEALASGVIDPTATPEQRRATVIEFRDGMRAAKQQRADNPLPTGNCS